MSKAVQVVTVKLMLVETEDDDLLRMLFGERATKAVAGIPLSVLLACDLPALQQAGLDRRSAERLAVAGELARRYGAHIGLRGQVIHQTSAEHIPSLVDLLREIGFAVFEGAENRRTT